MSDADLLRVALDDAPELEVTRDDDGVATLHVMHDDWSTPSWFALTVEEDKALRLVELLLVLAPHLPALLDAAANTEATAAYLRVRDALTEAGASL